MGHLSLFRLKVCFGYVKAINKWSISVQTKTSNAVSLTILMQKEISKPYELLVSA